MLPELERAILFATEGLAEMTRLAWLEAGLRSGDSSLAMTLAAEAYITYIYRALPWLSPGKTPFMLSPFDLWFDPERN
jgi:hypothetical protein